MTRWFVTNPSNMMMQNALVFFWFFEHCAIILNKTNCRKLMKLFKMINHWLIRKSFLVSAQIWKQCKLKQWFTIQLIWQKTSSIELSKTLNKPKFFIKLKSFEFIFEFQRHWLSVLLKARKHCVYLNFWFSILKQKEWRNFKTY